MAAKKPAQATKKAPAKQSAPKSAPKRRSAPPKQNGGPVRVEAASPVVRQNNQFWSVILFSAGILVLILAFYPGTKVWHAMHQGLLGIFGVGVFLVPLILGYTGILVGQSRSREASHRAIWGILLTLFCSTFVQLFFGAPFPESSPGVSSLDRFSDILKELWTQGTAVKGGGLISGIIALPLGAVFGEIVAKIIIVLFIGVLLLLLTQKSIVELFQMITFPFVWLVTGIIRLFREGFFLEDEFDDEDDEDDETAEPEQPVTDGRPADDDTPLPLIPHFERGRTRKKREEEAERRKKRRPRTQMEEVAFILEGDEPSAERYDNLEGFDMDIPITGMTVSEEENNQLEGTAQSGASGYKMSSEEELLLSKMVEDAARSDDSQSNRLPWLDDTDKSISDGTADDKVYEEDEPAIPYIAPPIALLKPSQNSSNDAEKSAELHEKGKQLVDTLASFGVQVRITGIRRGPTVTRYEIQPAAGVKISKITALADDIGLNLGGKSVRIEAPIPGKPAVGVEVPNNTKDMVSLREILETKEFTESQSKLTFAVGKDIDGNVILGDIAKMPHMIIAGTTGSGKSVCTNSIIMSILFHASPDEVRMVLIDPKVVEFQPYDGIPHLLIPVVTNPQKAAGALNWAVLEMERRYALCAQYGVRDLKGYNAIAEKNPEMKHLPQILILIDEFADLMMTVGKEVEASVVRIAQKARAAGIHLVIATQRPTVDVITGLIKSNVPSRIGMSVKSAQDSRIILDCSGAETLLGNGDLLFYPNGAREPRRVQGCFTSDAEVEAVAQFLKSNGTSDYDTEIMDAVEQNIPQAKGEKSADDEVGELTGDEALIVKAAELAVDAGQLSTTALQRRLKLGYAKAARIVDELEERGIIGPSEGAKPRRVLMSPQELTEWKLRLASGGNRIDSTGM